MIMILARQLGDFDYLDFLRFSESQQLTKDQCETQWNEALDRLMLSTHKELQATGAVLKKRWQEKDHMSNAGVFWSAVKRKRELNKGTLEVQTVVERGVCNIMANIASKRKRCPTIVDILTTLENPPRQYKNGDSYFNVRQAKSAPDDAGTNKEDTNEQDPGDQLAVSETNDDVDDIADVQEEPTDDIQEPHVDLEHILDDYDRASQEDMAKINSIIQTRQDF
ncbi:hypothetical protein EC968_010318 [Mortierella alpina]|nr:hypothetical protein EC968_010318 [Mortierella alpina]